MRDASATWTVTLRLVTGEVGSVEANRGIFTVFVPQAGWLFDMSNNTMQAAVYALDRSVAAAATRATDGRLSQKEGDAAVTAQAAEQFLVARWHANV